MSDRLEDLLRASTVQVRSGHGHGVGFFVAPSRVMTCAHVIEGNDFGSLVIRWDRDGYDPVEFPVAAPPLKLPGRGRPIPALDADYPDIAVLEVHGPADHPCVLLDPGWPEMEDRFQVFGYPSEGGTALLTPARLTYRGRHGTAPAAYLDLGSDTIKPGMAGAALLNLRTGAVCGVVVATKDSAKPDGALAVPWAEISAGLSEVTTANQAFHDADQRWNQARRQTGSLPLSAVPPQGAVEVTASARLTAKTGYTAVNEALPDGLGEMLADDNVLLVAGPEIPEARRAPGRMRLLRRLVEQTDDESVSMAGRQQILAGLATGNVDSAARLLHARQHDLEAMVAETYAVPSARSAYNALAQISFSGVINMSWDSLLLEVFRTRSPVVIRESSKEVLTAAKSKKFAFTWFAGDPNYEQIAISSGEMRARLFANETLSRFLTGSVQSSSLLFVGVHTSDIIDFFDAFRGSGPDISPTITRQRRYAVCAVDELWELNRSQLRDAFGVELIAYDPTEADALAGIIQRLLHVSRLRAVRSGTSARPRTPSQVLRRITLTNIGAFERLDLELGESWNLLLGINGCGKTTLLRAVALGLCGDHTFAVEAGGGLLRTGSDQGLIELQVGASRFRTELQRTLGGEVRVRANSLSPLEQGNWVVLGFPALRGIPLIAPSGISHAQASEPRVEDLLPLLRNQVDTRLDDIKQWIINIEARARQMGDARARQMLNRFFEVIGELTPGFMLEFDSVDQATWEVWVRTNDGLVSIDQLSQGMSSIIAWVGTLLQRMYDIYEDSDNPAAESAFVLIDELDAHLHPAWQRLLPSLTRDHFPRLQVLATSHSPLVAGSLRRGELFVAQRSPIESDGTERLVATVTAADVDPEGLRADQVLTSPLFGLMTSRSPDFGNKVDRYTQLLTAESRTPEEEAELQSLKSAISASYRDGETAAEREDEAGQQADLEQTLAEIEPNEQNAAALQRLADALGAAGGLDET